MLPDVDAVPRAELPALLRRLTELEARVRLRLAEMPAALPVAASRRLTADEGAAFVRCSPRWLLHATHGHRCQVPNSERLAVDPTTRRFLIFQRNPAPVNAIP